MSPCLTLRISHPSTHSSCFHWCPVALQFMQVQNFITLKSTLIDLLPCSSYLPGNPSNSWFRWLTKAASLLIAFAPIPCVPNSQPPHSVGCALMMLLVPNSSPFPASVTWPRCSASSTWTLAQPHMQIYPFIVRPVWVGWIISVSLNLNSYHLPAQNFQQGVPPFTPVFQTCAILPNLPFQFCLPVTFPVLWSN